MFFYKYEQTFWNTTDSSITAVYERYSVPNKLHPSFSFLVQILLSDFVRQNSKLTYWAQFNAKESDIYDFMGILLVLLCC